MYVLKETEIPSLNDSEVLAMARLKSTVSAVFNVEEIILFGSKARGDFTKDSDVDVLVIVEENNNYENKSKLSEITFEVNLEFETDFTCVLKNSQKWANGEGEYTSFITDIGNEGIEFDLKR